jgi:hypothetical protein
MFALKTFRKWCSWNSIIHYSSVLDESLSSVPKFLSISRMTFPSTLLFSDFVICDFFSVFSYYLGAGREEFDAMISRNANCVKIMNFLRYLQE